MDTLPLPSFTNKRRFCDLEAGEVPEKDENNIQQFRFLGYDIFVGRNAYSNENLVKNHPHRSCLWLHIKDAKGPHVVLCFEGKEEPKEVILRRAASLAVFLKNREDHPSITIAPLADVYKPSEEMTGVWKTWRKETIQL